METQLQIDEQITRISALFERFSALQRAQEEAFKTRFQAFVPGFEAALRQADEIHSTSAPGFNIFTLVEVAESELIHSKFIAFLLDPRAAHAQGNAFLKAFFQMLAEKNHGIEKHFHQPLSLPTDPFEKGHWLVRREAFFTSDDQLYNYMDIVLANSALGARYVIENKINAGEQPDQIHRYFNYLEHEAPVLPYRAVFFLTRSGYAATTANGVTYYPLSYQKDIPHWLELALREVKAPGVQELVRQYMKLVEEF